MAYATLLSITQSLEHILQPNDQSLVLPETEQQIMKSLQEKTSFLLSFLENDSLKCSDSNLEPRIRDVAYEAEAMIESGFSHQDYERSLAIVEELDSILEVVKMKERNQAEDLPQTKYLHTSSPDLGSTSKTYITGLHKEMMEIKVRLTGSPSRCEIISIVGMSGIGKTTLAETLYHDPRIVKHFDVRAWTTLSRDYHLQQMLTNLLDSIQNINHDSYPEDLAVHIHKTLKNRRYLIVMDDVWDTNAWNQVRRFFPNDSNGSRVILTTRLQEVADYVECRDSIYSLSLLSPDDSWKLLCQKVFQAQPCPPELEDVGKEIANNCKGLPLSLAVIGGILYKAERTLGYWRYVKQNFNYALHNTDDHFMLMLSLSYKHLPHHLRPCFLYMGVFPEDYAISKFKLIRLWVAEGFIKPAPSKCLEEVAHEYLENLIDRNMILIRERNHVDRIKKCGIHDLMRDLCLMIAQEEKFLKVVNLELDTPHEWTYNFRHLYIQSNSHNCLAGINGSFLCSPTESPNADLLSSVLSSHQLRVLDAEEIPFSKSQDDILDLGGLRYICFYYNETGKYWLPSSISKLSNLETLIITSMGKIMLPMEIWMMPRLRHIKTRKCFLPYPFDAEKSREKIVPLENLQTLKGVINLRFSEDVIKMMPNLKKLKVNFRKCGSSTDLSSYCIGNLDLLCQLETLNISVEDKSGRKYRYSMIEKFSLPPKLKKLTLDGFRLSQMHMAIIGSLRHLEKLNLRRITFDDSLWEVNEWEFLELKSLSLNDTDLVYLMANETNFPTLRTLYFTSCLELIGIPLEIGYIPTLTSIVASGCAKSVKDSLEEINKEQEDYGNDSLQIIPDILEEMFGPGPITEDAFVKALTETLKSRC